MKKLFLIPILALAGCVPITTKFSINEQTGVVTWNNPKDSAFDSFTLTKSNGVFSATISGWKSSNNPQVINAAGAADSAIVTAVGQQVIAGLQAGQQMMITQGASSAVNAAVSAGKGTVQGAVKAVTPTPAP